MIIRKKQIKENFFYYLIVCSLVMLTDTLWIRYSSINRFYLIILMGAIMLFIGLNHCPKRRVWDLSLFALPVIVTMIVNIDFNTLILYKLALIGICWVIVCKVQMEKLINYYINFMLFISIFSLFCTLLRPLIISMDFIPTIASGSYGTKQLFFTTVKMGSGNLFFLRNQGPFWEPGVYQAYLNFAIVLLLFSGVNRKRSTTEVIILCVTVISTVSTTGYIVLSLIFGAKLLSNENTSSRNKALIIILGIGIIIIASNNEDINYLLFDKLDTSSINNVSNATRIYSVTQNLNSILTNPVFGNAPSKFATYFQETVSSFGVVSLGVNTTTSLSVWALYGIVEFIVFNAGIILFCVMLRQNKLTSLALIFAFLIIYNTENLNYSLLFNLIPIWGFCRYSGGILYESRLYYNGS